MEHRVTVDWEGYELTLDITPGNEWELVHVFAKCGVCIESLDEVEEKIRQEFPMGDFLEWVSEELS